MSRLLDSNKLISKIEIVNAKADFPYKEVSFASSVSGRENYIQPAERFRIYLNPQPVKYILMFGDFVETGFLTDLIYQGVDGKPFDKGNYMHTFSSPNNLGSNMNLIINPDGGVTFPNKYSEPAKRWEKISNIKINKELNYFEITVPYTRMFELDSHYTDYDIGAIGAMKYIGVKYHDINFNSKKCIACYDFINDNTINAYDFLTNDILESSTEVNYLYYFNNRTSIVSQEDFIKNNFNVFEYAPFDENKAYGYYFNFGYEELTFGGEKITERRGELIGITGGGKNNFKNNGVDFGCAVVVQPHRLPPYLFNNITNEAILKTSAYRILVINKDFNLLHESMYKPGPLSIKKAINIISTKIIRKDNANPAGVTAGWGYSNGAFMKITFSIDISEFLTYMERTRKSIVFYFPRLITLGDVTQWLYTLPSIKYQNTKLEKGEKIFCFADPGGASSTCVDGGVTSVNVNHDYCVSIYKSLSEQWEVFNALEYKKDKNLFTISCEFPLENFKIWDGIYANEAYNNSITCLDDFLEQEAFIVGLFGDNFFDYGICSPFFYKKGVVDNTTQFLEYFHEKYNSLPSNIREYLIPLFSSGAKNEIAIHQKYAKVRQNPSLWGGGVWANINGESWMLRNIQLPTISRVKANNIFSLPTLCYFEFPDLSMPHKPQTRPEGFCDYEDINECIILPKDELIYKMYSCIYEDREHTKVVNLEGFVKHIPLQALEEYENLSILDLLPGFGSSWIRGD